MSFQKNQLDLLFFEALFSESRILKQIHTQGVYLIEDFDTLMLDLFLLLYKKVLIQETNTPLTLNALLMNHLYQQPGISKVRTRTAGSKYETYIIYKFFMDALFEKLRGSTQLQELKNQLDELNKQTTQEADMMPDSTTETRVFDDIESHALTIDELARIQKIHQQLKVMDEPPADMDDTLRQLIDTANECTQKTASDFEESPLDQAVVQSYETLKNNHEEHLEDPDSTAFLEAVSEALSESLTSEKENAFLQDPEPPPEYESPDSRIKGHFNSEFKAMLMDLEKRSQAERSQRMLKEGAYKNRGQHWETELPDDEPVEAYRIIDEKPLDSKAPHKEETQLTRKQSEEHGFLSDRPKTSEGELGSEAPSLGSLSEKLKEARTIKMHIHNRIQKTLNTLHLDRILEDAIMKLDRFNQEIKALNIEKDQFQSHSFDSVLDFFKRMEDPMMVRFLNKVGRKKTLAAKAQYEKHRAREIPTDRIVLSDDLNNLIDEELMPLALDIEAFENDFIDRFLHQNILTLDQISRASKHKGPIILCYDGSGSMEGDKILETKAHIIAFIEIARIQKRKLITIQFASAHEPLYIQEIHPKRVTAETITDLMDTFIRGGTDFEKPLRKAMEYIQSDRYKHADILFITDGVCDVSTAFKQQFRAVKTQKEFKLYTLIMHGNTYEDFRDIGDISDEVMEIKQRDLSDWNAKMSERIFSI